MEPRIFLNLFRQASFSSKSEWSNGNFKKLLPLIAKNKNLQRSVAALVASNIFVLFLAIVENWSLADFIWVYWFQSIIIGISIGIRILLFRFFVFGSKDLTKGTILANLLFFGFFLFHYGGFQYGYVTFIKDMFGPLNLANIYPAIIIFALNHFLSLWLNYSPKRQRVQKIVKLMISPYYRIFPMHFIIFIFVFLSIIFTFLKADRYWLSLLTLIAFIILKTIADVISHVSEHSKSLPPNVRIVQIENDKRAGKDAVSDLIQLNYLSLKKIDQAAKEVIKLWERTRKSAITLAAKSSQENLGYIEFVVLNAKGAELIKQGIVEYKDLEPGLGNTELANNVNLYLSALAIDEDYQGLGLAKRLWEGAKKYFLDNHVAIQELSTVIWNYDCQKFFSQFNFKKIGKDSAGHDVIVINLENNSLPKINNSIEL